VSQHQDTVLACGMPTIDLLMRFLLQDGWFGVLLIGTFNVGDFVGRFIPFWDKAVIKNIAALWTITVLRFIVILPLLFLMVYGEIRSNALAFATVFIMYVGGDRDLFRTWLWWRACGIACVMRDFALVSYCEK